MEAARFAALTGSFYSLIWMLLIFNGKKKYIMSKCARACVREAFKISTAVADDIFVKVDIKMR